MDEGGEWKNELRAELSPSRRIQSLFRGVGAQPWILERRDGSVRGTYDRLRENDHFSDAHDLAEVQRRLDSLSSGSGFTASHVVLGSNPVDVFGWEDACAGDLVFGPICTAVENCAWWRGRRRCRRLPTAVLGGFWLSRSLHLRRRKDWRRCGL